MSKSFVRDEVHGHVYEVHVHENAKKEIWKTFWILLVITLFEVGIAFSSLPKSVLQLIFIVLTIVKSYFIVFTFMHLKNERKFLRWIILLPFLFICYLIAVALREGTVMQDLTTYINGF